MKKLRNFSELKKLGIFNEDGQCILIDRALEWIEEVNDVRGNKRARGEVVNPDPDSSRMMLNIIRQFEVTEDKYIEKIEKLMKMFPDSIQPVSLPDNIQPKSIKLKHIQLIQPIELIRPKPIQLIKPIKLIQPIPPFQPLQPPKPPKPPEIWENELCNIPEKNLPLISDREERSIMADLLIPIEKMIEHCRAKGYSEHELIQRNRELSYSELLSMQDIINESSDSDLLSLWSACCINTILQLPTLPRESSLFNLETATKAFNHLSYLTKSFNQLYSQSNKRLISKIRKAFNNAQSIEENIEWIMLVQTINRELGTDISSIKLRMSLIQKNKPHRNNTTDKKEEILENLQTLLKLNKLGILNEVEQYILVNQALVWIEDVNDLHGFKKFRGEVVNPDPDSSRMMLKIICQLEINEKKLIEKIEKLMKVFPDNLQPALENVKIVELDNPEPVFITQRSQVVKGEAIYVHNHISVYLCKINWNGQEIDAVIKTYKVLAYDKNTQEKFQKEVEILSKTSGNDRFFLDYYGSFMDDAFEDDIQKVSYNIVMEYCPGSLSDLINKRKHADDRFSLDELNTIFFDLLEAFKMLVKLNINHRDIKPDNILVSKIGQLKIADFNVSRITEEVEESFMSTKEHTIGGTLSYMAPELRNAFKNWAPNQKYRPEKSDVFSLGVVFYQCATLNGPLRFNENPALREKVKENINFKCVQDLIYTMLAFEYRERPSFKKLCDMWSSSFPANRETEIVKSNSSFIIQTSLVTIGLLISNQETETVKLDSGFITQRSQIALGKAIHMHNNICVFQCKINWKGQEIDAVIKSYIVLDSDNRTKEKFQKEVEILSKISGKNRFFLDYYGSFTDDVIDNNIKKTCYSVVMEYCPNSLAELIREKKCYGERFSPDELNWICFDLLEAFKMLVEWKIYHRDINPKNILLSKNRQLKIVDFMTSRITEEAEDSFISTEEHTVGGTLSYMAPELKDAFINLMPNQKYRLERSDVYSLGLVFYQCATLKNPLRFNEVPEFREKVKEDIQIPILQNLIYAMLAFEYRERPSFKKLCGMWSNSFPANRETEIVKSNSSFIIQTSQVTIGLLISNQETERDKLDFGFITQRSQIALGNIIYMRNSIRVYQCKINWKGQEIDAVIKTYIVLDSDNRTKEKFQKEVEILSKISGKNRFFLDYYGSFTDDVIEDDTKKICYSVVMEYCPESLYNLISKRKNDGERFSPDELNRICFDLLEAFKILVEWKIYHRDIKPKSILVSKNEQLKIADFNISIINEEPEESFMPTIEHTVGGTPSYMAPELKDAFINWIPNQKYRPERSDVYSLGLVFYQCATLKEPTWFNEDPEFREKVKEDVQIPWLQNLIYAMLAFDYHERPSFNEALSLMERYKTNSLFS